jgi:uncharacterized protein with PIN domain
MIRHALIRLARKAERANLWRMAGTVWWLDERVADVQYKARSSIWRIRADANDAVTATLRAVGVTPLANRNHDKRHRCPGCHAVECDHPKRWYRLYVCRHCGTRHWPGLRWQRQVSPCDRNERASERS